MTIGKLSSTGLYNYFLGNNLNTIYSAFYKRGKDDLEWCQCTSNRDGELDFQHPLYKCNFRNGETLPEKVVVEWWCF